MCITWSNQFVFPHAQSNYIINTSLSSFFWLSFLFLFLFPFQMLHPIRIWRLHLSKHLVKNNRYKSSKIHAFKTKWIQRLWSTYMHPPLNFYTLSLQNSSFWTQAWRWNIFISCLHNVQITLQKIVTTYLVSHFLLHVQQLIFEIWSKM